MSASPEWNEVNYEHGDRTYVGYCHLWGGIITVTYEDDECVDHSKTAQLTPGGLDQERLATTLLGELVRELEVDVPA